MTQIKICGIRNSDDVHIMNRYLPDYIGFVFAESKRQVSITTASILAANVDSRIKKVGVFVNPTFDFVMHAIESCHLDVLQFHGEESPSFCRQFSQTVWKSIRVKDCSSLDLAKSYNQLDGLLLDAFSDQAYGGTGEVFQWSLITKLTTNLDLIIAGGINHDNAKECISKTSPNIIDVSSSVEYDNLNHATIDFKEGKDPVKVKEFIELVRTYNE